MHWSADGSTAVGEAIPDAATHGPARLHLSLAAIPLRPRGGYLLRCVLLVGAYYAAAHVGYALRFAGPVASVVWLPAGIGIAALYRLGLRFWPALVVGDLLVNNYSALPVGAAIGQSFGNLLEIVIGAVLLRQVTARHAPLATRAGVAGMVGALAVPTLVSAVIGSLSLVLWHVVAAGSFIHVWRTWWLGDFCGSLIVVSLTLAFTSAPSRPWLRGHGIEAGLLVVTLVVLSTLASHGGQHESYLAFPALIWAALRFGPRGTTLAIALSAAFSIWGATHLFGPFEVQTFNGSLLYIQLYLVVTALSALAVVALAGERDRLAERLRASRMRIVVAADEERRRLERNLHDGAQQRLTALAVRLGQAARRVHADPDTAATSFDSAQADLLAAIEELRDLVHGIRPAALRQFGLARAVETVAARSATPIEIVALPELLLDETAETTAYFVVLEAVTNAERHAAASRIRIRAHLGGTALDLEVHDDGVGGAFERNGLGLQGLRDRVEATGGRLTVTSKPGNGTCVRAAIPATVRPRHREA